jgi:hypothetical protein
MGCAEDFGKRVMECAKRHSVKETNISMGSSAWTMRGQYVPQQKEDAMHVNGSGIGQYWERALTWKAGEIGHGKALGSPQEKTQRRPSLFPSFGAALGRVLPN